MPLPSARRTTSIPAEVTTFVGRQHEIGAVQQLFSISRLVTLTGFGGVGKTRLAMRVASTMSRSFRDGMFLIELASLTDPRLIPQALVDTIGMRVRPGLDPLSAIVEHLRERSVLLILDSCEHLTEAVGDLAGLIMQGAPGVKLMVTSQHALRIAGEHIYPVPPLPVPTPSDAPAPGTASHYPSVALFAERAAAVVPGFAITTENEAAVVRLCHRLEGIPLAIELAAVRLRVLSVDELSSRLDDRFDLLRESSRNVLRRHQTLLALIDWSYDLCAPTEQLLWARASVFADGFTGAALEDVCGDEVLPRADVLEIASRLVDKSVLVRDEVDGHVRFRMLDTLRDYGRARLGEIGDASAIARRHRDWYAALIRTAGAGWAGSRQTVWATQLRLEHANLRRALDYCMSTPGEARIGLEMAAVPWFWGAMDHLAEGQLWLERGLALHDEPTIERVWALATFGYDAAFQGDLTRMLDFADRAFALAVELDDPRGLAFAQHVLGFSKSISRTTLEDAVPLLTDALDQYNAGAVIAEQYVDSLLVELATVHVLLLNHRRAKELTDLLHDRCQAAGERWNLSYALWLRGLLALREDDAERAEGELLEALRIKRDFHDTIGLGLALEVVGWAAAQRGDGERAGLMLGGSDQVWRTLGARQLRGLRAQYETKARAEIGDRRYEAAVARGRRLSLDDVLAAALREPSPPNSETVTRGESIPLPVKLTSRERQVAVLVAAGMSNKEIATTLVIAQRTAEGHVERSLAKLGFRTRAQLAAWVSTQPGLAENMPTTATMP